MNKYLKLSIFFTALWILIFFAIMPLCFYLISRIPALVYSYSSFIMKLWEWGFYVIYYGAFVSAFLAIITGIIASREAIRTKSKWASVALILASANTLYLFGVIYASL